MDKLFGALKYWDVYWGTSYMGTIFVVIAVYYAFFYKKNVIIRQASIYSLFALFIIICPGFYNVCKLIIGTDVYWRSFWLLPTVLLVAYMAVDFVRIRDSRKDKILACIMIVGVLIITSPSIFVEDNFIRVTNRQKITDESVTLAEIIKKHRGNNEIHLAAAKEIATYIRIYDPSIITMWGRDGRGTTDAGRRFLDEVENPVPNVEKVVKYAKLYHCNYLILKPRGNINNEMEKRGFVDIGQVVDYVIFYSKDIKPEINIDLVDDAGDEV